MRCFFGGKSIRGANTAKAKHEQYAALLLPSVMHLPFKNIRPSILLHYIMLSIPLWILVQNPPFLVHFFLTLLVITAIQFWFIVLHILVVSIQTLTTSLGFGCKSIPVIVFVKDLLFPPNSRLGIDFGSCYATMSQYFLNWTQISPIGKEIGCKCMP